MTNGAEQAGYWWLSFANEKRFLGGLLIDANSFEEAIAISHALGLNPGGEVKGAFAGSDPKNYPTNKLLNKEEIDKLDAQNALGKDR